MVALVTHILRADTRHALLSLLWPCNLRLSCDLLLQAPPPTNSNVTASVQFTLFSQLLPRLCREPLLNGEYSSQLKPFEPSQGPLNSKPIV